jgi:hypothetical protein
VPQELKPGSRWRSAVCDTEVVVVKAPGDAVSLECGGYPMVALDDAPPDGLVLQADHAGGTQLGKRFADPDSGIEVLASKAGAGSLAVNGKAIPMKGAKPLPSSD